MRTIYLSLLLLGACGSGSQTAETAAASSTTDTGSDAQTALVAAPPCVPPVVIPNTSTKLLCDFTMVEIFDGAYTILCGSASTYTTVPGNTGATGPYVEIAAALNTAFAADGFMPTTYLDVAGKAANQPNTYRIQGGAIEGQNPWVNFYNTVDGYVYLSFGTKAQVPTAMCQE